MGSIDSESGCVEISGMRMMCELKMKMGMGMGMEMGMEMGKMWK